MPTRCIIYTVVLKWTHFGASHLTNKQFINKRIKAVRQDDRQRTIQQHVPQPTETDCSQSGEQSVDTCDRTTMPLPDATQDLPHAVPVNHYQKHTMPWTFNDDSSNGSQLKTIPPSLRLATLPGLAASRRLWNDFHPATLCQCQPTTAKHVSNHPSTDTSPVRRDIGQKLVAVTWTSRNLQDDEWQTLTNTQNSQKSQCFTCDIGVRAGHNINQFKLN